VSPAIAAPENEFAQVAERAAGLGLAEAPPVNRKWVNVSTGGHVSGVVWGSGPGIVLVHRPEREARSLDDVALLLRRPVVVLDLPGSGRSNGPATRPRRAGPLLAEAVASFAAQARLIAGIGEGGLSALATLGRRLSLTGVVLIDALPGLDDQPDDRVLWDQLAGAAQVEVLRSSDSPITAGHTARLAEANPAAVVTDLPFAAREVESAGAAELANVLLAAARRAETT
jgi:pimeloyl-ACP methyl ester carboxylesterase